MTCRALLRAGASVVALAAVLAGCGTSETGAAAPPARSDPSADYWSECPETPVYDRDLESVTDAGSESPSAAVLAVAPEKTDVEKVVLDASATSADVDVRLGDDTGVFHVSKRPTGWLVKGGEGCAAWSAGRAVMGPLPDCDAAAYCDTQLVVPDSSPAG